MSFLIWQTNNDILLWLCVSSSLGQFILQQVVSSCYPKKGPVVPLSIPLPQDSSLAILGHDQDQCVVTIMCRVIWLSNSKCDIQYLPPKTSNIVQTLLNLYIPTLPNWPILPKLCRTPLHSKYGRTLLSWQTHTPPIWRGGQAFLEGVGIGLGLHRNKDGQGHHLLESIRNF